MTNTLPRVAIYVDAQNLYYPARDFGRTVGIPDGRADYEQIAVEAIRAAADILGVDWRTVEVEVQRIYTTSKKRALAFESALENLGYTVRSQILRQNDSFDWDVALACDAVVDAVRDVGRTRIVVLVTGDGDFAHLTETLDGLGVRNVVLGFPGTTSLRFRNVVHLSRAAVYSAESEA